MTKLLVEAISIVDDLMAACDTTGESDSCWASRLPNIEAAFNFRTWLREDHLHYCGADACSAERTFDTYTRKLKPMTLDKNPTD